MRNVILHFDDLNKGSKYDVSNSRETASKLQMDDGGGTERVKNLSGTKDKMKGQRRGKDKDREAPEKKPEEDRVHIYIFVCVRVHVCANACVHMCAQMHVCTCVFACMCVCTHALARVRPFSLLTILKYLCHRSSILKGR